MAVLTGINEQHLETFKSIENIKKTKYELFENLPSDGKAFFDVSNDASRELSEIFTGEKYLVNGENSILTATDVSVSADGTLFTLNADEQSVKCFTTLIGRHSVRNILLASTVAYKMGLTLAEISCGIARLHGVKHRLEVLPNNKGVTLIDDSYNSNLNGFNCAIDALSLFDGRKIIVTPGVVELGENQYAVNYKIGQILATSCDKLVISAKYNAEALINGFSDAGGNKDNIAYKPNFIDAKKYVGEILTAGDVVLFENDLPDIYN
jgi:UDP-N-acetylmuramoyl-tripeptide--D-alanyl-D-alanine ligase